MIDTVRILYRFELSGGSFYTELANGEHSLRCEQHFCTQLCNNSTRTRLRATGRLTWNGHFAHFSVTQQYFTPFQAMVMLPTLARTMLHPARDHLNALSWPSFKQRYATPCKQASFLRLAQMPSEVVSRTISLRGRKGGTFTVLINHISRSEHMLDCNVRYRLTCQVKNGETDVSWSATQTWHSAYVPVFLRA